MFLDYELYVLLENQELPELEYTPCMERTNCLSRQHIDRNTVKTSQPINQLKFHSSKHSFLSNACGSLPQEFEKAYSLPGAGGCLNLKLLNAWQVTHDYCYWSVGGS